MSRVAARIPKRKQVVNGFNKVVRIVVADPMPLIGAAVAELFSATARYEIVDQVDRSDALCRKLLETSVDVVTFETDLPGMPIVELLKQLKKLRTPGIAVTARADEATVAEILRHGASGYVLKTDHPELLFSAVESVANGDVFITPKLKRLSFALFTGSRGFDNPLRTLTSRETEVFKLAAEGLTNRQIGKALSISSRTVESHRSMVLKKLHLRNQTELVRTAVRLGVLTA